MIGRVAKRLGRQDGIMLIELLVATVVLGIFVAMFAVAVSSALRHSSVTMEQTTLGAEARAAVDTLAQDLRQASSAVDGTCPVEVATATSIRFLSPDRAAAAHERRIAVQLAGGNLQRALTTSSSTAPPWTGLAWTTPPAGAWAKQLGSVTNTSPFTYYDANGAQLPAPVSPSAIRSVGISVTVSATGSGGRQSTYATRATIRVEPTC
jgi:Tfp pilus assembly protein PilW